MSKYIRGPKIQLIFLQIYLSRNIKYKKKKKKRKKRKQWENPTDLEAQIKPRG